ncbi:MAG TPA: DUF167 domain-containing protein [Pyrinomonadaceae bacterium]|nr:DUF167 domain-containing protein [Pyrinomonadaceae bacterium]
MIEISEDGACITFSVRVAPRSSRSAIVGEYEGMLKVSILAAPVDGAANIELIKLLSKQLDVPKSCVEIVAGANSRNKKIRISGITAEHLRQTIG